MQRTSRRPLLAAVLSVLQPGIGHLYLRAWLRAALWGGLWLATAGAAIHTTGLWSVESIAGVAGVVGPLVQFPAGIGLAILSVTALATLDSYRLAVRSERERDAPQCPDCGRTPDPELEFCHWCTASLADDVNRQRSNPADGEDRTSPDRLP